jgi:hypothetical protein
MWLRVQKVAFGTHASSAVALWLVKPMHRDIGWRIEVRQRSFGSVLDRFWIVGDGSIQQEPRRSEPTNWAVHGRNYNTPIKTNLFIKQNPFHKKG